MKKYIQMEYNTGPGYIIKSIQRIINNNKKRRFVLRLYVMPCNLNHMSGWFF